MHGRTSEHRHNTDEQVREYIVNALALVDDLDPPGDLRAAVFVKAVEFYAAKQILMEQVVPGVPNLAIPRGVR